MSATNQKNGVSAFDLEPNPFEQSFASTEGQQPGSSGTLQGQSYISQDGQPFLSQNFQQRPDSRPPLNVGRSTDGKSPFIYGSQKPNILSPPLLTPGGFRRLPPLLLSPSVPSQNHGTSNGNNVTNGHNGNNNNVGVGPLPSSQTSGLAVTGTGNGGSVSTGGGATNSHTSIKPEPSRTPSFLLNLSKTGLTPNESGVRTGLTPGILAPGQSHHHYPTLPAINGTNQGHLPVKPGSVVGGSVTPAPFTPCLGSLLGFPGNASPGQITRPPLNQEVSYSASNESVIGQENSMSGQHGPHHLQQQQPHIQPISQQRQHNYHYHHPQQQQQSSIRRTPPHSDSPQVLQQQQPSVGRKRNTSNASKSSKSLKRSQGSTPNSIETRRLSKNEDLVSHTEENKDLSEDDQERKRKEFLERNRVAASKFRKRKKEYIKRVEMDLQFYENEYEDMARALDKLCGIIHGSPTPAASSSLMSLLENSISNNDVPSSLSILAHMKQVVYETKYFQRSGRNPRRELESNQTHETDDEDRHRTDNESIGNVRSRNSSTTGSTDLNRMKRSSSINYPGSVPATFTNAGVQSQHQSHQQLQNQQPPHTAPMTTGSLPNFPPDNGNFQGIIKNEGNSSSTLPGSFIDSKQSQSGQDVANNVESISDVTNGREVVLVNDIHAQGASNVNSISNMRHNSLVDLANQSLGTQVGPPKYSNAQ